MILSLQGLLKFIQPVGVLPNRTGGHRLMEEAWFTPDATSEVLQALVLSLVRPTTQGYAIVTRLPIKVESIMMLRPGIRLWVRLVAKIDVLGRPLRKL